jgi:hypothetical protein
VGKEKKRKEKEAIKEYLGRKGLNTCEYFFPGYLLVLKSGY